MDIRRFMHGRRNIERRDSVSEEILHERMLHQQRLAALDTTTSTPIELVKAIQAMGLGTKRRKHTVYKSHQPRAPSWSDHHDSTPITGSGFAVHLASASKLWPVFKHILPEIAFAGHSNSGKSTLVNAMVGILPKKGPASISERAGWTDQICFYQLGRKPPVLIVADLPGYGHAVATSDDKKQWKFMTRDYLGSRIVLSKCCVLVDCTRGLCAADRQMLLFLHRAGVPWHVILTKCDLLSPLQVAQSMMVVEQDLRDDGLFTKGVAPDKSETTREKGQNMDAMSLLSNHVILPVSAATGAGVHRLWLQLRDSALQATVPRHRPRQPQSTEDDEEKGATTAAGDDGDYDSEEENHDDEKPIHPSAVREHRDAALLRKADYIRQLEKFKR